MLLKLKLYLIKVKIQFLFLLVLHFLHNEIKLQMDIPLILCRLPSLVTIDNVFVDDPNLLIEPEHLAAVLVLHFSSDGSYMLMELVYLLQLDQKKLVPDNTFY